MKTPALYFFRTVCALVLMPLVFIVIYPLIYMILPETADRLADLPRDLAIFILVEAVVVPIVSVWIYIRSRREGSEIRRRESRDTRDVL